jgi:arylsulfatase
VLYDRWLVEHVFVQVPIQAIAAEWLSSFKEFPPRSKPASFTLDRVVEEFMPHP